MRALLASTFIIFRLHILDLPQRHQVSEILVKKLQWPFKALHWEIMLRLVFSTCTQRAFHLMCSAAMQCRCTVHDSLLDLGSKFSNNAVALPSQNVVDGCW